MENLVRKIIEGVTNTLENLKHEDLFILTSEGIKRFDGNILNISSIIYTNESGILVSNHISLDKEPYRIIRDFALKDKLKELNTVTSLQESISGIVFKSRCNNVFDISDYKLIVTEYLKKVEYPIVEKYEDWMRDVCPDKEIFDINTGTFISKKLVKN